MLRHTCIASIASVAAVASAQAAVTLDGQNIPTEAATNGIPLLATQDTATQFGNATGGGQDSAGGSELNALYADITGGTLRLLITGNLEGNFNKMWILFDAISGGENPLGNDNADGGFGEINALAGLSFDTGFTPDHGLRLEVGGGFHSVRLFDLLDNSAVDVTTGGGPGDLPLSGVSGNGVSLGWDNSNTLGVDNVSAAAAATATTGWEFEIDLATAFGASPNSVGITVFISSGDGTFLSNQVLPGIGGGDNLGSPSDDTLGFVTAVPEPASLALLGAGGLLIASRRRGA